MLELKVSIKGYDLDEIRHELKRVLNLVSYTNYCHDEFIQFDLIGEVEEQPILIDIEEDSIKGLITAWVMDPDVEIKGTSKRQIASQLSEKGFTKENGYRIAFSRDGMVKGKFIWEEELSKEIE